MRYANIKKLPCDDFRRMTGVKPKTFGAMIGVLTVAERKQHEKGGKWSEIPLEDRLLMALSYWREYRTYFHVAGTYGISESRCHDIIKWVEDTLIKNKQFHLPGRKALLASDTAFEVVLVDATETPIERPKKNKNTSTPAKRNATR
jgi:hypothetical protein